MKLGTVGTDSFDKVLDVTGPTLGHVRLRGAGPESSTGSSASGGVGTVLKELALGGYSGTVALAPSASSREEDWREWLFEERGWGCNTAAIKKATR